MDILSWHTLHRQSLPERTVLNRVKGFFEVDDRYSQWKLELFCLLGKDRDREQMIVAQNPGRNPAWSTGWAANKMSLMRSLMILLKIL